MRITHGQSGTTAQARPSALARTDRERLAQLVAAASYGTVLVLTALCVVGLSEIDLGYGAELVAGVGAATWIAHLFAELLGGHVLRDRPLERAELSRAALDGLPILVAPVLPAVVLLLGRVDVLSDRAARVLAIVLAVVQLLAIGVVVGRVAPARRGAVWIYGAVTVTVGLVVCVLAVRLGH